MKREISFAVLVLLSFVTPAGADRPDSLREVFFKTGDGGEIAANLYGRGGHAVVLAHGAVFNKESWHSLSAALSSKGYSVLALDFRGYGKSTSGSKDKALYLDVLAAASYLRSGGAKTVSLIGASMGGGAVAQAAVEAQKGEIDSIILLSPVPVQNPELMKANKFLFIASRDEPLMPKVKEQYELAPEPKKLELLEGSAHAQHIFKTEQADELTRLIVNFLSNK